jgi:cell division protein FtsL
MKFKNSLEDQKFADKPTRSWKGKLIYIFVALVLIASSSIAVYIWQQQTVLSLNNKLTSQNDKLNFIKKERDGLNKQLNVLSTKNTKLLSEINSSAIASSQDQSEPIPESTLDISVLGAKKYVNPNNPAQTRYVAVDVSVVNNSSQELNFQISDFQLSDEFNNTSGNYGTFAGQTTPNGLTVLDSQVIMPGKSAKGVLVFNTLNEPAGFFTLTYKSKTFKITLE